MSTRLQPRTQVDYPASLRTQQNYASQSRLRNRLRSETPMTHLHEPQSEDIRGRVLSYLNADKAASQVAESFAEAASMLYTKAEASLVKHRADLVQDIVKFGQQAALVLSQNNDLYSNITTALSATICHSDKHSSASIATHLENFLERLAHANERLHALEQEYDTCTQTERLAITAINDPELQMPSPNVDTGMGDFKKEAREILETQCRALEDIEAEYVDKIQVETRKMAEYLMEE